MLVIKKLEILVLVTLILFNMVWNYKPVYTGSFFTSNDHTIVNHLGKHKQMLMLTCAQQIQSMMCDLCLQIKSLFYLVVWSHSVNTLTDMHA